MSYKVNSTPPFEKQTKKLLKNYPTLKNDLYLLIKSLELNPIQGNSLGNDFYKIRVAISGKAKGKSGGARVIISVKITKKTDYLAAIFDKSEQENITDKELKWLAEIIGKM